MLTNEKVTESRGDYRIIWNGLLGFAPSIQLKYGIKRKLFSLEKVETKNRNSLFFHNDYVELTGKWDNSPGFGSLLSFKLKNISKSSIRLARLVFPAENGLDIFLKSFKASDISFLRNGYQSWSTARSYKLIDKPLRPWLQLVSLTSSNMANLPSNTPGILSSEMYSIISDLKSDRTFLIGQSLPFNQFFYIRLNIYTKINKPSHFEIVYDFGRKMIKPQETIELDGIIMAQGKTSSLLTQYFNYIKQKKNIKIPKKNIKGWCSWYYYYNKISPEKLVKNINVLKERKLKLDLFQIDDGYQKYVGDWLNLMPNFRGRMKELSSRIVDAGMLPGIWIAPFIADKKSELIQIHPEYVLRNEYGRPIVAGYNPVWPGKYYYGLDITHPRFEEYIRSVIRTIVNDWGFKYIKIDFLYGACLRGGTHHDLSLTRAEVMKYGVKIIRDEAGSDIVLAGCGMPLSTGIGMVDVMRVGPDTAPYWKKVSGAFLQTGAMIGARNSLRNFIVRSAMNKCLWVNDPDCLMIRRKKTKLTKHQRNSQINAILLSGGTLLYSDDLSELLNEEIQDIRKINFLSEECYKGFSIALDLMEKEIPELYFNTAGYLGVFNFKRIYFSKKIDFSQYELLPNDIKILKDVWTDEEIILDGDSTFKIKMMEPYSSRLFRLIH